MGNDRVEKIGWIGLSLAWSTVTISSQVTVYCKRESDTTHTIDKADKLNFEALSELEGEKIEW